MNMKKIYKQLMTTRLIPLRLGIAILILFSSLFTERALSQDLKLISGKVTEDPNGATLPGVSIRVKGTERGATTNAEGKYSIQARSSDILVFSFLGMKSREIQVGTKTTINIALSVDASALQEVVVIGYGTVRKSDLTGSVGQVDIEDISKAPVASFAEALAGRVAGVTVGSVDGQPGAGLNITIRGSGSLTQNTSPLYVVDGFPIEDLDPATINPEEIESMTILKDASSTAIYGSRAANGVIVIKTKRGMVGKAVINVSSSVGVQLDPKQIELMSPYEYIKYQMELTPNVASTKAFFSNGKTLEDYRNVKGVNFQDHVFRTGAAQIHNIAMRGGTEETKYSISGSIFDQEGVIINTGFDRYSGRLTIDQNIGKKIKAGITGDYSASKQNGQVINQVSASNAGYVNNANPNSYVLARTWLYRPITPYIGGDDLLNNDVDDDAITQFDVRVNPFIDLLNQSDYTKSSVLEGNGFVSYAITKDLTFRTQGVYRLGTVNRDQFNNSKTAAGSPNIFNPNGVNGMTLNTLSSYIYNSNTLNYKKTINKDHVITGLGLFEMSGGRYTAKGYSGKLLPNQNLGIDGLDEGVPYNLISNNSRNTLMSYASRWDYNYKSKYILTATFRADGSSKFLNNKWGYFPGGAIAWNMQKEGFFAKLFPGISTSKIRLSYGSNGNNRIGDFTYSPRLSQTLDGYAFNNNPVGGITVTNVGNSDLKWETVTTLDLGYELGILKDRISLEVDLYRKETKDLLLNSSLPPTTGFATAIKNIGGLKNEGLEFTLNTTNIKSSSFIWQSNLNISFNKNQVTELTRGQRSLPSIATYFNQFNNPLYLAQIGRSAGMMIGYVWEGNFQYSDFDSPSPGVYQLKPSVSTNGAARTSIQPGDIKYKDLNNDGIINTADITFIGRGTPIHAGGFSNNFTYKGFDLNVFLQWSYGNDLYNANRLLLEGNSNNGANINQFASYVNRWTPDNQTNANYRAGGVGPIGFHSSRVVEDGSYLRLKTVSLSYAIPERFIKKAYLNGLSVNVSAQNLATWTNYSGLDPDVSARNNVLTPGYDYSAYPKSPTLVFGLKAAF